METIKLKLLSFNLLAIISLTFFPLITFAATASTTVKTNVVVTKKLEVSGWLPYWKTASSTADALEHIDYFQEISPFGFIVKNTGVIYDPMDIATTSWQTLIKTARDKKIKIIPTVMWSNGDAIDKFLRSSKLRKAHVKNIKKIVSENNFDGIDIDYEGKKASTNKYFSLFLKELKASIGKKILSCTIEARTPLDSLFDVIPKDIKRANDFVAINKYCDRVRIMTYDQGRADLRLNETATGPYAPIADVQWVEKVVNLTAKTISKKKIVIGVATYGREYEVNSSLVGYKYRFLNSFNHAYALDMASQFGVAPTRNQAGEMSVTYVSTSTLPALSTVIYGQPFRLLWWSDAGAIKEKIDLAKKLGVRGVSIFKIDGGEDPLLWEALKQI